MGRTSLRRLLAFFALLMLTGLAPAQGHLPFDFVVDQLDINGPDQQDSSAVRTA